MKKFNQTIEIKISVDSIANQLLENMNPEFKHAEMVTEAIIGNLLNTKTGVPHLYNTLNGYTNEIDFKVGDMIKLAPGEREQSYYGYVEADNEFKREYIKFTEAQVVEVNLYVHNKLRVVLKGVDSLGKAKDYFEWVDHTIFNRVETELTLAL